MEITMYLDKYKYARYNFFKWRYELTLVHKIILAFAFACITGLVAQFRFYLPWTPVPITGQVFAVLLAGVLLGRFGGVSQIMYVGLGAVGLPWFAGFNGGLAYIAGPTGGYIIGFILAAFFVGYFTDRYVKSRKFVAMFPLMLFATFVLIYVPGLVQLYLWSTLVAGTSVGIIELLTMGMIPFIAGDVTKTVVAAAVANAVTPKTAYGREIDAS